MDHHHRLKGYELEQALGVGNGQRTLACCSPQGRKEWDTTEQLNWTELTVLKALSFCESVSCSGVSDSSRPIDCSLPGSSVHGILQARIGGVAAMPSSRGPSHPGTGPRSPALQADSLPPDPPGKPIFELLNMIKKKLIQLMRVK